MPLTAIKFNFTKFQEDEDTFSMMLHGIEQDYKYIRGNTYEIKEELKRIGGHWYPQLKLWAVPLRNYGKAMCLLDTKDVYKRPLKRTPNGDQPWTAW